MGDNKTEKPSKEKTEEKVVEIEAKVVETEVEQKPDLEVALTDLKDIIETQLNKKQQGMVLEWIKFYGQLIVKEQTFNPVDDTLKYEPGTVLSVDLGYNPGSELGGNHYAVVVEDNAKTSKTVMVVPLGSLSKHKTERDVNRNDAYLGEIPDINQVSGYPEGTKSIAKISQMRAISKMRIQAPLNAGDKIIQIPPTSLKKIYDKIRLRFTTKGLNKTPKN